VQIEMHKHELIEFGHLTDENTHRVAAISLKTIEASELCGTIGRHL